MSGIGGVAGLAGAFIPQEENQGSTSNYAGSALSGASAGISAGAALGPIGMAAGAAVGGIAGLFSQKSKDRAQRRAENQAQINENAKTIDEMSGSLRAKYSMRTSKNYAVPGFKNGIAEFNGANALIANEEGVRDPSTGRVDIVPGRYDSSNPDKVYANLKDGTSVYSNAYSVPGGKSTPAKLVAKMKKVQDSGIS